MLPNSRLCSNRYYQGELDTRQVESPSIRLPIGAIQVRQAYFRTTIVRRVSAALRELCAGSAESRRPSTSPMSTMLDIGLRYCKTPIQSVIDIGANDGHDTRMLAEYFNVEPSSVIAVEAHPQLCEALRENLPGFRIVESAITDHDGIAALAAVNALASNNGVSSLRRRRLATYDYDTMSITTPTQTLKSLIENTDWESVGFVKIDVEGMSYEVLKGAEDRLQDIVALQVETEMIEVFEGQHLHFEVAELLNSHGFVMTYLQRYVTQADTVWVRSECLAQPGEFYTDSMRCETQETTRD